MSEYMFGVGRGQLKTAALRKIDAIAGRHGATITNPKLPGEGWKYWFSAPNRGAPFDGATRLAVIEDLEANGMWIDGQGLADKCFV